MQITDLDIGRRIPFCPVLRSLCTGRRLRYTVALHKRLVPVRCRRGFANSSLSNSRLLRCRPSQPRGRRLDHEIIDDAAAMPSRSLKAPERQLHIAGVIREAHANGAVVRRQHTIRLAWHIELIAELFHRPVRALRWLSGNNLSVVPMTFRGRRGVARSAWREITVNAHFIFLLFSEDTLYQIFILIYTVKHASPFVHVFRNT